MPDRQRDAVLEPDLVADGVDDPVDPGHRSSVRPSPVTGSVPVSPASRSTARSTETVVCRWARSMTGCAARAASSRARAHQRRGRGRALRHARSPIGLPSTSSSRQRRPRAVAQDGGQGLRRSAQRARSAGAPTASGPSGCSARAACQPPWVAASKASNGRRPEPAVRWSTAACTPPHGSSGVTGASLPRASGHAGVGEVGERVAGQRPARRRAARRTCRRVAAPGRVEGRLHAGDHRPGRASARSRRRRPSRRAPAGAGRRGRRPTPSSADDGADGVEHLADRGVADAVEAGLDAGLACTRARGRPATPSRSAARRQVSGRSV